MFKISEYAKTAFWIILLLQLSSPILKKMSRNLFDTVEPKNKVGYLILNDAICSSAKINSQLKKFFKDSDIKAILLKIDSPGGAAGSSEAISQEIINLKKEFPKPIVTYSENICASGAYQIAAATDYIICTNSALVGSIGTKFSTIFKLNDTLEKYDVKMHSVSSGSYKNSTDPFVAMTEQQQAMLQELTDNSYQQFVSDICKYRHLNLSQQSCWAEGKIFTGKTALKLKLIDEIGNMSTALQYIRHKILHTDREIELIKPCSPSRLEQWLYPDEENDDDTTETTCARFVGSVLNNVLTRHSIQH